MDLLTLTRIIFLLSLGVYLLSPNEVCRVLAGISSIVLCVLVVTGRF